MRYDIYPCLDLQAQILIVASGLLVSISIKTDLLFRHYLIEPTGYLRASMSNTTYRSQHRNKTSAQLHVLLPLNSNVYELESISAYPCRAQQKLLDRIKHQINWFGWHSNLDLLCINLHKQQLIKLKTLMSTVSIIYRNKVLDGDFVICYEASLFQTRSLSNVSDHSEKNAEDSLEKLNHVTIAMSR